MDSAAKLFEQLGRLGCVFWIDRESGVLLEACKGGRLCYTPVFVYKRQFGYVKVRYRRLKKNTAQLFTLFALSNLWMTRKQLIGAWG